MIKKLFQKYSIWAFLVSVIMIITVRVSYHSNNETNGYNATTWDALGYYIYLPSIFIYEDVHDLKWFPEVDSTYQLSGGEFYQASQQENGQYVFKYLGGVSLMQAPFFAMAHLYAQNSDHKADGFSSPYQYAIIWGAIIWFILGLWILRKVLLEYFSESTTAITLILVVGATNLIQYVGVEGAMSHAYIFPLYAIVLWWTLLWHKKPKKKYAIGLGFIIGLATISRPTELIMVFIPILWSLENSGSLKSKWKLVGQNKTHILYAIAGGLIGILPQLIYWKIASGSWIYDVGSKWFFLNPWWRVLFGFEKGWFIYTPITLFFIVGLFFLKGKPYRKAIITFCLLNIWIIISWSDWQYGASYSTRALTQSYPVFALALAALIEKVWIKKWKIIVATIGLYLLSLNLFQIWQYNTGILHYYDMNAKYYKAIYWNASPTPLDYSLLDSDEIIPENVQQQLQTVSDTSLKNIELQAWESIIIYEQKDPEFKWIETNVEIITTSGINNGQIVITCFQQKEQMKQKKYRLAVPNSKNDKKMIYKNHVLVPDNTKKVEIKIEGFNPMRIKSVKSNVKTD